jgi:hypothetical protein
VVKKESDPINEIVPFVVYELEEVDEPR